MESLNLHQYQVEIQSSDRPVIKHELWTGTNSQDQRYRQVCQFIDRTFNKTDR